MKPSYLANGREGTRPLGAFYRALSALTITCVAVALLPPSASAATSGRRPRPVRTGIAEQKRSFPVGEFGVRRPTAMTYRSGADELVLAEGRRSRIILAGVTPAEDALGSRSIASPRGPVALATRKGHIVGVTSGGLLSARAADLWRRGTPARRAPGPKIQGVRGAAFGPDGTLFVLDGAARQIVVTRGARAVRRISLAHLGPAPPRGLAIGSNDRLLYVTVGTTLYGLNRIGVVRARYDLGALSVEAVQAIVFGPTADPTDDAGAISLFMLADTGAPGSFEVKELTLRETRPGPSARAAGSPSAVLGLIQTIDLSALSPPSPDPSGIAYIPGSDHFIVTDGEVDEMGIYRGVNLFRVTRTGAYVNGGTSVGWSNEPVGGTFDPATETLIVSDDDEDDVSFIDHGGDGVYGNADDVVREMNVKSILGGSADPEGVAFDTDTGHLWIADGLGSEVYEINPGPNGIFGDGDDTNSHFDAQGANDPEAITYHAETRSLLVLDKHSILYEFDKTGNLLRTLDATAAGAMTPAGIELAPSSVDPSELSLWIVDRRLDNDSNPTENDGKLFEMTFGGAVPRPNGAPEVQILEPSGGAVLPERTPTTFVGEANDAEEGEIGATIVWASNRDGILGSGASLYETLSVGTHIITATATDADGASTSSSVTVSVWDGSSISLQSVVAANTDDAEQRVSNGVMMLTGSDLELGSDGTIAQLVGLRFRPAIPRGSRITNAYVQFRADETSPPDPTSLVIRGQAIDDAPSFGTAAFDIGSRARTSSSVTWNPDPWLLVDAAGPEHRTPNLSSIVEEIVSRPGWRSGNGLALIISGTGRRTADPIEGGFAPQLHIDYQPPDEAPVIEITSPGEGTEHSIQEAVPFRGAANDVPEGTLSSRVIWTSSEDGRLGVGPSFNRVLSEGIHTITATAHDAEGSTGVASVTITIVNEPPVVTISAPQTGSSHSDSAPVTLTGSAIDLEDEELTASMRWTSNIDGPLGTGGTITPLLSPGRHTITASATDLNAATSSAAIVITIENQLPTVTISAPANGATVAPARPVTFSASASDLEDGTISSLIEWHSSRDGLIGRGASFTTNLSEGMHTITASVRDSDGAPGSAAITLAAVNRVPVATITAPADGATHAPARSLSFAGSASDVEDGAVSSTLVWTSDRDGVIGTGPSFTTQLTAGTHLITATARDTHGMTGAATITLQIENRIPIVTITAPANGSSFSPAVARTFSGTATDVEDGVLTSSLRWTSSINGSIGTGGSFTRPLTAGAHTITAAATDSHGTIGSASITVRVEDQSPIVTVDLPADGSMHSLAETVTFRGSARDDESGTLTSSIAWASSIDGPIGAGATFARRLSAGAHTITASVTDTHGTTTTRQIDIVVENFAPEVAITTPAASYPSGTMIRLSAGATDAEDGDISGGIAWRSSIDGPIGSEPTIRARLSDGIHMLTAEITDSGGRTGSSEITVEFGAPPPPVTVSLPIATGADDAEERISNGSLVTGGSDLELGIDGTIRQLVGLRFAVPVPQGSHVLNAYVQFRSDEPNTDPASINIAADAADDAVPFAGANSIGSRALTAATVQWDPAPWPTIDATGPDQRTPNLAPLVNEILTRAGWRSGNSVALIFNGTGRRTADPIEGGFAPVLVVEYRDVPATQAPDVSIASPGNGSSHPLGRAISFEASAFDHADGDLSSQLEWVSDRDGVIGTGALFSTVLSDGAHRITASVIDANNAIGNQSIDLVLENQMPVVAITAPADGSTHPPRVAATLSATATDLEDGSLTSAIEWTSSIDGPVGTGGSVSTILSEGVHTITATATDSGGVSGTRSITLTVVNFLPEIVMSDPVAGSRHSISWLIPFAASATDHEDGDLTSSIAWTSSIDGPIGTGAGFSAMLSQGVHTIRAAVTDWHGATTIAERTISVDNYLPDVTIATPADRSLYPSATLIAFSASATDTEDGPVSGSIVWRSSIDGALGTGQSIRARLSDGDHVITGEVTDSGGSTGTSLISVSVGAPPPPTTISVAVALGADDVEEQVSSGSLSVNGSDLELGEDGTNAQRVGLRFAVPVPRDAVITNATVQFQADEVSPTGPVALQIRGQAADTATPFVGAGTIGSRALTDASIDWSPPAWTAVGAAGPEQLTPNLAPVIQEIVNRPGWQSGNHLALVITGTGRRTADPIEGGFAPVLTIEYQDVAATEAPAVEITSPIDGSEHGLRQTLTFDATAIDRVDGDMTSGLAWTSSIDGPIGTAGTFSTVLSEGVHTISAEVTDSSHAIGIDEITVTIANQVPQVTIAAPVDASMHPPLRPITFDGSATDVEDASLTGSLRWISSIDGQIGTGASFTTTLTPGLHIITAEATDSLGATGSAQISLNIVNVLPDVVMNDPVADSRHSISWLIPFAATATDHEDGDLTSSIAWTSLIDGPIGSGASFSTMLSQGVHTIRATSTDTHGESTTIERTITVDDFVPEVTVATPPERSSYPAGTTIAFNASATDTEDGPVSSTIVWRSSIDGPLGAGPSIRARLSDGVHILTAEATDSAGGVGSTAITVELAVPPPPHTFAIPIATGLDDAEEQISTGALATGGNDLELGADGTIPQRVGLRYALPVPPGARITNASVQFRAREVSPAGPVSLTIRGEAADDAAPFVGAGTIGARALTASSVPWTPSAWTTVGAAGPDQRSPDLTRIVQEIVDRPGWRSGNHLALVVTGTSRRTADSVESGLGPVLHVEYADVPDTEAPTIEITSPAAGSKHGLRQTLTFTGSAHDRVDGDLSAGLAWTSSIDGPIGTGPSFSAVLSEGVHSIAADVTDSSSAIGIGSITLTVANQIPRVTIDAPVDASTHPPLRPLAFGGAATDVEDAALTDSMHWVSSIDGEIGTGGSFTTTLTPGAHTITASATDSLGAAGSAQITLSVVNFLPEVTMSDPPAGSRHSISWLIPFAAVSTDHEDGELTSAIAWTSSIDGPIGTGAAFSTMLSEGVHTIRATSTDTHGESTTIDRTITVDNFVPEISITVPEPSYPSDTTIALSAAATDTEDGAISSVIAWSSSIDGPIGSGASIRTHLSDGTHTLTAAATDSGGRTGSNTVTVTLGVETTPRTISIPIAIGTDDVEENASTGALAAGGNDLELGADGTIPQRVGLRFAVPVPQRARINNAFIQFRADEVSPAGAVSLQIRGQAADSATAFSGAGTVGARALTTASVGWIPPAWTTVDAAGPEQRTPNLASVLQEIVNRPGWRSGNPLALVITGTGRRTADPIEGGFAPMLTIEYADIPPTQAPAVQITSPAADSTSGLGQELTFTASAIDQADGDLSSGLAWTSSIDGPIGTGRTFTRRLSEGMHTITAEVTDSHDAVGIQSITLVVANEAPVVSMDLPLDPSVHSVIDLIAFGARAADRADGDLSSGLAWTSSIDGPIGTGAGFNRRLSAGTHTITASVSDAHGVPGSDAVTITVQDHAPDLTVTAPVDGYHGSVSRSISFEGTARDYEDGDLTPSMTWTSSIDGPIGTGASFATSLTEGPHVITAQVTDSNAVTVTRTLTIDIVNYVPDVVISAPVDPSTYSSGTLLELRASSADVEDGTLDPAIAWTSSVDGPLGTGPSIRARLSDGAHVVTAATTDSMGRTGTDTVAVTVGGATAPRTLTIPVAVGADDVEENASTGALAATGGDLELGADGTIPQRVGLRFAAPIPQGVRVTNAAVQFRSDEVSPTGAVSLQIRGQAADNAAAFSGANTIGARALTSASVGWVPPAWTAINAAGPEQRTPNIASIVQEIVNRPGWRSGNALALVITGTGRRTADPIEGGFAPALTIEYLATPPTSAPAVDIATPSDGATVGLRQPVTYTASALDAGDGNLASQLTWTSSIDGPIGTGASLSQTLSEGTHTITAEVSDSTNAIGSDSISVTVANEPPVVAMTAPADGSSHSVARAISFAASASDRADGDLTSAIGWTSSLDGPIGRGGSFERTLSEGRHTITASAADGHGVQGAASVTIDIVDRAPVIVLGAPETGTQYSVSSAIVFQGSANDEEDGNLTPALQWSSSIDGPIGTGASFSAHLSPGVHEIAAAVTDSNGITTRQTVSIEAVNNAPVVSIATPAAGTSYPAGTLLELRSSANDTEDGTLDSVIEWSSSIDGRLGTGSSVRARLSNGAHTLSASATDSMGRTGAISRTVTIGVGSSARAITIPIAVGADDAEENASTGALAVGGGDLELGADGTIPQRVGLRYAVPLPQGAQVTNAFVQFRADEVSPTGAVSLQIRGQGADTAAAFAGAGTIRARALTSASVGWVPPAWTANAAGPEQRTPNIAPIVQEIVNRLGWRSGNALALVITGTGRRTADPIEGGFAPVLTIEYQETPSSSAPVVDITAPADGARLDVEIDATFRGSALDGGDGDVARALSWMSSIDGPLGTGASVTRRLTEGTHAITAEVTDSSGAIGSDQTTITVGIEPPAVTITSPAGGSIHSVARAVSLTGVAQDGADGDLTSGLVWNSSLDGALGTGGTVSRTLREGTHTITTSVTDSNGGIGAASITLEIVDRPPIVMLESPADGSRHSVSSPIDFRGSAVDQEDGDLTSSLRWTSSIDGVIGIGASFSARLSEGTHEIAAEATDSNAVTSRRTITIDVLNHAPDVRIASPAAGGSYSTGTTIGFSASASDVEDGGLDPAIEWTSSIDGALGTGPSIRARLSDGTHTVTAEATDAGGRTGSATISLTVGGATSPRVLTIPIAVGADDAEENASTGALAVGGGDLELGADGTIPQRVGLRFSVPVPQGAQITNATVQFRTDEVSPTGAVSLVIKGQAADNAAAFSGAGTIRARTLTTASVGWVPPAWTTVGGAGAAERTPNIASLISEIVNRPGWRSGNHLALVITGTGRRTADPIEGGFAPRLMIEFLEAPPPSAPAVEITSPGDGAMQGLGQQVAFTASALDGGDGNLAPQLAWTSSIDGPIGTGGSLDRTLSEGLHTITAEVTDSTGAIGSDTITVTVANEAPVVTLTSPTDASSHSVVQTVTFTGSAYDRADGDLTGTIEWTSSLDGAIGTGGSFSRTLSEGTHTITASVSDAHGVDGSASVTIEVVDRAPVVTRDAPAGGSRHSVSSPITFRASASDEEDGPLTTALRWSSSIDGAIGTGGSFEAMLSEGSHTIRVTVADSNGTTTSHEISIVVENFIPSVRIASPADPTSYPSGTMIEFTGSASDTEDGSLGSMIQWSSSIDGLLGTGATIRTHLRDGTHTITASARDNGGATGTGQITVILGDVGAERSLSVAVAAGADDVEENISTGGLSATGTDLELGADQTISQRVGLRYAVPLPQGAHVTNAYVQFRVDEVSTGATSLNIRGQAADTAAAFAGAGTVGSRALTSASVPWTPAAWPTTNAAGVDQRTPNLASIVNEIVARPGWTSGNRLVLVVTGTGRRTADSFEGGFAPTLHIDYTVTPATAPPAVQITSPDDASTHTPGDPISFEGSAGDLADGDLASGLVWVSDLDGEIGRGAAFTANLGAGTHTITASVADSTGAVGYDSVSITIA